MFEKDKLLLKRKIKSYKSFKDNRINSLIAFILIYHFIVDRKGKEKFDDVIEDVHNIYKEFLSDPEFRRWIYGN